MRASEILRQIADVIDRVEGGGPAQVPHASIAVVQPAQVTSADEEPAVAKLLPTNQEPQSAQDGATMASPLQQELEIMKKAAGIPSAFDGHQE
jgi:hypothetical protein